VTWLGNDLGLLAKLPKDVTGAFAKAARPALIVGGGALAAGQGAAQALVDKLGLIKESWNGYNVLHISAARMGGLMLGYAQANGMADIAAAKPKLTFLLGADDVKADAIEGSFKVYVGHHGDKGAALADVILPAAAYAEKSGTYVNLEGRVQRGDRAVFPPGDAREDWAIFRACPKCSARSFRSTRSRRCATRWRRKCRLWVSSAWPNMIGRCPSSPPRRRARSLTRSRIST